MSARPYIVGIAGGTGSGKTTVALKLAGAMPAGRCITLEHDAYYRDQGHLSPEVRAELNYDHPAALESSLLSHHLRELRAGHAVEVPIYDFTTHTRRRETRTVEPAPVGFQRSNIRGTGKPAKMPIRGTPQAAATCWPAESYPT